MCLNEFSVWIKIFTWKLWKLPLKPRFCKQTFTLFIEGSHDAPFRVKLTVSLTKRFQLQVNILFLLHTHKHKHTFMWRPSLRKSHLSSLHLDQSLEFLDVVASPKSQCSYNRRLGVVQTNSKPKIDEKLEGQHGT